MIWISLGIAFVLVLAALMVACIGVYAGPDHRWDDDRETGAHS